MAIPMTNIPVLTGKVAERFVEQCEYNVHNGVKKEKTDLTQSLRSSTKEKSNQKMIRLGALGTRILYKIRRCSIRK